MEREKGRRLGEGVMVEPVGLVRSWPGPRHN